MLRKFLNRKAIMRNPIARQMSFDIQNREGIGSLLSSPTKGRKRKPTDESGSEYSSGNSESEEEEEKKSANNTPHLRRDQNRPGRKVSRYDSFMERVNGNKKNMKK